MLREAVVFLAVVVLAVAFLERAQLDPIPEKFKGQKGCYIKDLDRVVPFGDKVPGKSRCVEHRCSEDGVTIAGCGVLAVTPPCFTVTDTSAPYPDCCPKLTCPK